VKIRHFLIAIVACTSTTGFALTSSGKTASTSSLSTLGGNGQYGFGLLGGIVNSSQDDLNALIARSNARANGISTTQMNQAYELDAFVEFRFTGTMYAIQFRPGYFYEVKNGMSSGQDYDYAVKGITLFPIFKMYPLENDLMKVYLQLGLGYGQMYGEIHEAGAVAQFESGAFGSIVGIGAQIYVTQNSCLALEVNYRYLSFDRALVDNSIGSFANNSLNTAKAKSWKWTAAT
jgi:hypothetical protein